MIIRRYIRPVTKPQGERLSLRVRVTYAQRSADFYPGITIEREEWDAKKKRVVKNPSSAKLNKTIAQYMSSLEKIFERYEVNEERIPSLSELRAEWGRMTGHEPEPHTSSVASLLRRFTKEEGTRCGWTESTYKKFKTIGNHIERFSPKLKISDVTEDTLAGFTSFLIKNGLRNSTVMKDMKLVRWFLGWARRKGLYDGDAHVSYRPRLKGGDSPGEVIFLTREELVSVEECKIPQSKNYLSRVRDLFIFSCYSGLRFSDTQQLTKDMVRDDEIHLTTRKTDTPLTIQLNRRTRDILAKGELPRISNQKANKYLHELLELAGVDSPVKRVWFRGGKRIEESIPKYKAVTFHAARRTFVTQGLALGISPEVIVKWTGHSDTKGLRPYLDIVEELKKKSMTRFDDL